MRSPRWSIRSIAAARPAGSIGGAYQQTSELLLNGAPDATWDGRLAYSPPQDAVQEVHVKVSDTDAAFGHSAGGTLDHITKTGTNFLHGSAWEFNQPNTLTANDFFLNRAGSPRPVTHFNQYGVTAGGPFYVPKVIDTRNKLFWFFAWEGIKDGQPNAFIGTVPTDAMRAGNFAGLTTLYDPFSATLSGTTVNRTALPGNQIPANELNAIAKAYLTYFPEPTTPTATINNFVSSPNTNDIYSNEMGRIDYNMSDRSRFFADVRHTDYSQGKNNYFNNIAEGSLLYRANLGLAADEVFTLNPTDVVDIRLNFTRMNEGHNIPSVGFDPTSLGFPSYLGGNCDLPANARDFFQQRHRPAGARRHRRQQAALPVLPALPHLDDNQGQPHPQGRRRFPAVPFEYPHLRRFHRDLHLQQQLGPGLQQRFLDGRHRAGLRRLPVRTAFERQLRRQHHRLLVFVLRRGVRAGRLESEEQPHHQCRAALRPRWPLQRKIRPHRGRLHYHYSQSAGRRRPGGLCQVSHRAASGQRFQCARRLDLPGLRPDGGLPESTLTW